MQILNFSPFHACIHGALQLCLVCSTYLEKQVGQTRHLMSNRKTCMKWAKIQDLYSVWYKDVLVHKTEKLGKIYFIWIGPNLDWSKSESPIRSSKNLL